MKLDQHYNIKDFNPDTARCPVCQMILATDKDPDRIILECDSSDHNFKSWYFTRSDGRLLFDGFEYNFPLSEFQVNTYVWSRMVLTRRGESDIDYDFVIDYCPDFLEAILNAGVLI